MNAEPVPNPAPLKWDIEDTDADFVDPVKTALREVYDPEIGMNVIQLGLVRNITHLPDGGFVIHMIMTTPFCPYASNLIDQVQQKASTILPETVSMSLDMDAWDFSMMEDPSSFSWGIY